MLVYLNGHLIDDKKATVPIRDAGLLYGHGVYESFRTFAGKTKLLQEHLERLKESAEALFIPFSYSFDELETAVKQLIEARQKEEPGHEFRIRMTLTAGNTDIRTASEASPLLFITAKRLSSEPMQPLNMRSFRMVRQVPEVKTTAMLAAILGQHHALSKQADEALLTDGNDMVHESSFSNIYLIKNGVLLIPNSGALKGITQALIRQLAKDVLPIKSKPLSLNDFYKADEVFTSGSVRGIVAVRMIDGHSLQAPGSYTQEIQKLFQEWAEAP
ncbi:MAG TPA: aminotransferase class IV [Candidatus Saccharimonadales bacterium]|nr:aminotransferase class IV [Candidatus Saccharimonadales bacterium]